MQKRWLNMVARHDPDAMTEARSSICVAIADYPDPAFSRAANRTLEDVEW
jgi:uncharacterized heparinase superfamily protein